jgi:hypothetical protein
MVENRMTHAPACFRFTDIETKRRFVIELVKPRKIEHARRSPRGEEHSCVHVQGTSMKGLS